MLHYHISSVVFDRPWLEAAWVKAQQDWEGSWRKTLRDEISIDNYRITLRQR